MLRGLDIRDMLLIDRLELMFQPGLNVLTGETGAGKSILLDSLGFVLGWRGRAELVRQGASQGEVTAWFDLSPQHPARAVLEEAGFPVADELILRRINTAEGRKTAFVNDRRTSGEVLRALSDTLVELHGQHDDRGLLNPRGHMALLDQFAGVDLPLAATRAAWRSWSAARKALEQAQKEITAIRAEEDFLRHAVDELDQLSPEPGEEATLDAERRRMQGAERIRDSVLSAVRALGADGAEGQMADAMRWLDSAAGQSDGLLDGPLESLGRAMNELAEAEQGVLACLDALDFDPRTLEATEERLFAIRGLARKHGVLPDDLSGFADGLRGRLNALDAGEADLSRLSGEVAAAETEYTAAAERLTALRQEAAERLDAAMSAELAPLKMERAVFATRVAPAEPGPDGSDSVDFTVATNPGAPAGPLGKIASGGELSRFLLALKVCLTRSDTGLTLIFDEIDRGVGGATADAVGRRLSSLAEGQQVLVVTHSPQVAALGQHHWRVEKSVSGDVTTSNVVPLNAAQRVDEIARMLSGDTVTDEARGAAAKLLTG
ncbi:DNA repair protein RecN [Oceaniglobus trochenteri]|uniref:DNA repair protein RecN n=1 Tax=Oceaniglobus trochenteri TaxID=2763260 RepID=UPI001CFFB8C2|nr:DNA repair protein RecN [Oceaniglobus trochenteri]